MTQPDAIPFAISGTVLVPTFGDNNARVGAGPASTISVKPGQSVTLSFIGVLGIMADPGARGATQALTPIPNDNYTIILAGNNLQTSHLKGSFAPGQTSTSRTTSTSNTLSTSSNNILSTSCSTTSTTGTNTAGGVNVVPLLAAYSSMSMSFNGTAGAGSASSQSTRFTESYKTVYASSTTYKVDVTSSFGSQVQNYTVWVLKSGTILAVDVAGQNFTGSQAQQFAVGAFTAFTLQIQADQQLGVYTSSSFFHSSGTSTVTIGSSTFTVTDYAANTLPETVDGCGFSSTLTAFQLSVGTPPGASSAIVTYEHFAGSSSNGGQTTNYDYTIQLTSFTLA